MARRNVLQEIPILVPQTERQSYEVISEEEEEEEESLLHSKQISAERPHSRYISHDESKENITPTQLEEKSDADDEPGPSSRTGEETTPKRRTEGSPDNPPLDFCTLTVDDLGISSESFTPKHAGRSPKSLRKYRRRSTIGVRGSPEMNFLIRQIALQRSNRKSEPEPPEHPFTSPRNSLLREKISAFRNAFQAVEETEGKLSFPGFSEVEELQSEKGKGEVRSEPPEKRKKVCDPRDAGVSSILPKPSVTFCPAQPLESSQKSLPENILESERSWASRFSTEVPSKSVKEQSDETQTLPSSSRCRKRKVMFAGLLSPPEPEHFLTLQSEASSGAALKPALKKTPRRDFVHFLVGFGEEKRALFSSEESTDNDSDHKAEDSVKQKKRVTFGRELSPELFDKNLPANTPLRRGSTPYHYHTLDATPSAEQSACQSPCDPMPQPDFDDQDEEETLQPLSLCFDAESSDCDSPSSSSLPGHRDECVPTEEEEAAGLTSLSTDHEPVTSSDEAAEEIATNADPLNDALIIPPDVSPTGTRNTRSSNKRKVAGSEEAPGSYGLKTKVKSTGKKTRKLVITKKVQIRTSHGKGKKKGGKSKKSLQKPVYSDREVVSKKPLLSPIPELPECLPTPPASTSHDFPHGGALHKHLVKKIRPQARDGEVNIQERNTEGMDTERQTTCVLEDVQTPLDPAPEVTKVSNNGWPENSDVLSLAPHADPVDGECPLVTTGMEQTDQMSKQVTSGVSHNSEEAVSKTKNTKRRSSTRKNSSHPPVTEMIVKPDKDADVSHKPETIIDDPVQGTAALSSMSCELAEENTTTGYSKPPTAGHKKTRRSSRVHHVSNIPPANHEQNAPGENASAALPYLVDSSMSSELAKENTTTGSSKPCTAGHKKSRRSSRVHHVSNIPPANHEQNAPGEISSAALPYPVDSSMDDFCLPIDEPLQFPPQEKKVRRSMRLRRDSGVIGLSWVEANKDGETTGRRESLSSVMRLEESSAPSLENIGHSPNKENLGTVHVPNITKRGRRRTLCTTTIQESASTADTKRRRSNYFHKVPAGNEVVHSTLVADV